MAATNLDFLFTFPAPDDVGVFGTAARRFARGPRGQCTIGADARFPILDAFLDHDFSCRIAQDIGVFLQELGYSLFESHFKPPLVSVSMLILRLGQTANLTRQRVQCRLVRFAELPFQG